MSWHSWVIGWLKGFHCLKVRTLLRFHSDWKFHFVSTTYFFPLIWFGDYPSGSLERKAHNFQYWKSCAFLAINISLPFNSKSKKTFNWFYPWPKNMTFHFHFEVSFWTKKNPSQDFRNSFGKGIRNQQEGGGRLRLCNYFNFSL